MWQSAWAPSSEWQGLAVNANGREQLTEKRIIISLHYVYTDCLSVSLPSSGPRREQQSALAVLYLPVLQETKTSFGVNASSTRGTEISGASCSDSTSAIEGINIIHRCSVDDTQIQSHVKLLAGRS